MMWEVTPYGAEREEQRTGTFKTTGHSATVSITNGKPRGKTGGRSERVFFPFRRSANSSPFDLTAAAAAGQTWASAQPEKSLAASQGRSGWRLYIAAYIGGAKTQFSSPSSSVGISLAAAVNALWAIK